MQFCKILKGNKKTKLGLALGSGGARGMAHIGALKAFEENNINFDVVAGSSIGSIVGGLYAKGYTANDMASLIMQSSKTNGQSLVKLRLKIISVLQFLKNTIGYIHFEDLNIPFTAVAVDLYTGEEVLLSEGDLCHAMSASSAIPPFLPAVNYNGKMLIDGAFKNSVPADVCKNMGADKVVGINLSVGQNATAISKQMLDMLYKGNKVELCDSSKKGYEFCDIMLEPNLNKYSPMDIYGLEEMFDIGYNEAMSQIDKIKQLLK